MIYYQVTADYEITVRGHANYQKKGKDIVCSSVSTALILTSNLIKRFGYLKLVELELSEGDFYLKPIDLTTNLKIILDNLVWTLKELEEQYPKNIKRSENNV
ncbi:MAG: ribosomal-processing cysteine protease Prp [Acholeplasmatales bacterium]|jgi:uncharacterized protein YsxB (DUF464 family)|nr:ribosomal-processing cysteine protease Prp [Acholeplasmataceae bacterium]MDY0115447.1 ribosomal-processing cysteine protease Prp [Acholeplasmatales bacterium]MCK9234021.1 ribosomal-processing cysteine protease Prp [Acholeplasmataceae bacterium]MCK9289617.1 ribosomal-processing cysteine protease Prp [Acholeplasmataceae bacterium]MCK9427629.1 ribosomal-processing cysteine protease Prp [Acholeplasmataceae bacterium]